MTLVCSRHTFFSHLKHTVALSVSRWGPLVAFVASLILLSAILFHVFNHILLKFSFQRLIYTDIGTGKCKKIANISSIKLFLGTTAATIRDTNRWSFYRFFKKCSAFYGFMYFSSQSLDGDVITMERNADLMHTISLCVFNNAMRARLLSPPPLMRCIYTIKWFERSELAIIFIYSGATASQKFPYILYIQGVLKILPFPFQLWTLCSYRH